MYYGEIKKCDIANGPGVRVSLFVSDAPIIVRAVLMRKHGVLSMESLLQKKQKNRF